MVSPSRQNIVAELRSLESGVQQYMASETLTLASESYTGAEVLAPVTGGGTGEGGGRRGGSPRRGASGGSRGRRLTGGLATGPLRPPTAVIANSQAENGGFSGHEGASEDMLRSGPRYVQIRDGPYLDRQVLPRRLQGPHLEAKDEARAQVVSHERKVVCIRLVAQE